MKKIITIITILYVGFIGYNNFSFDKSMEDGKEAIINKEYREAKNLFEKAVEKKSDSREALALYRQTDKLIEIINLEKENNLDEAINLCKNIFRKHLLASKLYNFSHLSSILLLQTTDKGQASLEVVNFL